MGVAHDSFIDGASPPRAPRIVMSRVRTASLPRRLTVLVALAITSASASACHRTGPRAIRQGRANYNLAIQLTNSEQLLLNLVRLRYRDPPVFLEVTSVATNFSVDLGAGVSGSFVEGGPQGAGLSGSASYSEKPTVTYVPLRGQEFVSQLLSPLDTSTLLLMYHSGWSIDRVLRVCLQRLGRLPNAPRASGPTPVEAPEYEAFFAATRVLRTLWSRGQVDLRFALVGDRNELVMSVTERGRHTPEYQQFIELLGVPDSGGYFILSTQPTAGRRNHIPIVTRSLMASLHYLSHGVTAPARDQKAGLVTTTVDARGHEFDWDRVTGRLMRVSSGDHKPDDAAVAVRYRNTWFWINDDDLDSKSTFALLIQLLELQSSDMKTQGPLLTLPVNG